MTEADYCPLSGSTPDYPTTPPKAATHPVLDQEPPAGPWANTDRSIPLAYVAGPYRDARGAYYVEQNIRAAEAVAVELWRLGFAVICPHTNTRMFDGAAPDAVWLAGDLEMVRRVDVLVTLPTWALSQGARNEVNCAHISGVLVAHWGSPDGRQILKLIGAGGRGLVRQILRDQQTRN